MHRTHPIHDHPAGRTTVCSIESLLRDPLIRLVMDSDGVTEDAIIALMNRVLRSSERRRNRLHVLGHVVANDATRVSE